MVVATKASLPAPRVAVVHDWLTSKGGAERVVEALLKAYPQADLYSSVYSPDKLPQFKDKVKTSFLQHWPLSRRKHQLFPVLRTLAFESFDLSSYDIVISSSSAESKGIVTPTETLHISYIHTPVRYYWSNYEEYQRNPGFGALNAVIRPIIPFFVKRMRHWDYAAAQRPDALIANSETVKKRIKKYYDRDSVVINPPVDYERLYSEPSSAGDYYLIVSRLVPYKRCDLAVEACTKLKKRLVVVGDGPELPKLRSIAGETVEFKGYAEDSEIEDLYRGCRAFIFCGEEDFGITPVEAMACGKPVIAYGRGGAAETVADGKTGVLFDRQTVADLSRAIKRSEGLSWDKASIAKHAKGYSEDIFVSKIKDYIDKCREGLDYAPTD